MRQTSTIAILVLSALIAMAESKNIPAGRCDTNIIHPIKLPYSDLIKYTEWKIIYATLFPPLFNIDHGRRDVTRLPGFAVNVVDTLVSTNNSRESYTVKVSFEEYAFVEEFTDEKGQYHTVYNYPLGITSENAVLYLRCSEDGSLDSIYTSLPWHIIFTTVLTNTGIVTTIILGEYMTLAVTLGWTPGISNSQQLIRFLKKDASN